MNSELTDLYYISLYSSRKPDEETRELASSSSVKPSGAVAATIGGSVVILTSQGNAGEESGVVTLLGIYEEKGIHNEVKFNQIRNLYSPKKTAKILIPS